VDGIIAGVSISHTRADLEQLEAAARESQRAAVTALLAEPGVEEAFVLQTCNRVEGYVVTAEAAAGPEALSLLTDPVSDDVVDELGHEASLRHLLRVAAGLESLVLGEDQILGQVRTAYEDAREVGGIGPLLDDGITKAIRVGERARTETAINEGVVSLASAAVKLTAEKRGLAGATAAVVGAGEMGSLAASRLAERVDRLVVANRTESRAAHLSERLSDAPATVEIAAFDRLPDTLERADVVVSATGSPGRVVEAETLTGTDETFVVDLARPRDIPPAVDDADHLTVYDLDRLETVTQKTRRMRRKAAERVERIVDEEFDRLLVQYKRKQADDVISRMYEGAERVKAQELETAFEKLDLDEDDREVVESMADAIVSQLLAAPTDSLRDAAEADDWSTIHTALRLFNPDLEPDDRDADDGPEPPAVMADVDPEDIPDDVRDEIPAAVLESLEE